MSMELLHQRLGPHVTGDDVAQIDVESIPQYDLYKDEFQNAETFPTLGKEPEITLK